MLKMSRYQRAFIDFFEDQLVSNRYHLQELLDEYLLGGKEPLINGMISGRKCKQENGLTLLIPLQLHIPLSILATHMSLTPQQ